MDKGTIVKEQVPERGDPGPASGNVGTPFTTVDNFFVDIWYSEKLFLFQKGSQYWNWLCTYFVYLSGGIESLKLFKILSIFSIQHVYHIVYTFN